MRDLLHCSKHWTKMIYSIYLSNIPFNQIGNNIFQWPFRQYFRVNEIAFLCRWSNKHKMLQGMQEYISVLEEIKSNVQTCVHLDQTDELAVFVAFGRNTFLKTHLNSVQIHLNSPFWADSIEDETPGLWVQFNSNYCASNSFNRLWSHFFCKHNNKIEK